MGDCVLFPALVSDSFRHGDAFENFGGGACYISGVFHSC